MNPTLTTGTSLEILAPYLPYGIEMFGPFPKSEHPGSARKLLGLYMPPYAERPVFNTVNESDFNDYSFIDFFLPVLRPFSALCDPLPDGTVPAVEVAKLARNVVGDIGSASTERFLFGCEDDEDNEIGELFIRNAGLWGRGNGVIITESWEVFTSTHRNEAAYNQFAILDYLRSKHFAVCLDPSQFIPKK